MLNGHKMKCPKCSDSLTELRISYMTYVDMDSAEREAFRSLCGNDDSLKDLSTTYRMYKYSKWYKEQQAPLTAQAIYFDDNVSTVTN